MKVSNQAPTVTKRPVQLTSDIYEIWYSKPQSLGKIHNVKGYWFCADGMRFVSSRDAMEYLIRMLEASGPVEKVRIQETVQKKETSPAPMLPKLIRKGATAPTNQNHPKFQEFLEFQRWQAQNKAKVLNQ